MGVYSFIGSMVIETDVYSALIAKMSEVIRNLVTTKPDRDWHSLTDSNPCVFVKHPARHIGSM